MSRTSLIRPRRPRAVWDRPATGTRLLPSPPHLNPHYKRCPKAQRLRLRSDQSPSRPPYGRSPDKLRHALSRGPCQVRATLTRRISFASSGDAPEHGVIVLPWATAPFSDSAVAAIAGQSEQSDERRLKKPTHHLGIPPSSPSEISGLRTPVTGPRSHPLGWSSTSGGRDRPTASPSRVSSTSSQKHGAVAKPASMWNIRCRGKRPSVQASPSSCATVRDLPSPPPSVPSPVGATGWSPWGGASLPHHPRKEPPTSPYPHNLPCPSLPLLRRPSPSESAKNFARNNQAGTSF